MNRTPYKGHTHEQNTIQRPYTHTQNTTQRLYTHREHHTKAIHTNRTPHKGYTHKQNTTQRLYTQTDHHTKAIHTNRTVYKMLYHLYETPLTQPLCGLFGHCYVLPATRCRFPTTSLLLTKGGQGIFNVSNCLGECCAHGGNRHLLGTAELELKLKHFISQGLKFSFSQNLSNN